MFHPQTSVSAQTEWKFGFYTLNNPQGNVPMAWGSETEKCIYYAHFRKPSSKQKNPTGTIVFRLLVGKATSQMDPTLPPWRYPLANTSAANEQVFQPAALPCAASLDTANTPLGEVLMMMTSFVIGNGEFSWEILPERKPLTPSGSVTSSSELYVAAAASDGILESPRRQNYINFRRRDLIDNTPP